MTPQQAKALLPIITAFAEGKQIQLKYQDEKWHTLEDPEFNAEPWLYRIKPEPKRMRFALLGDNSDHWIDHIKEENWTKIQLNSLFIKWISDPIELYLED